MWKGAWAGLRMFQMNSGSLYSASAVTSWPVEVAEYGLKVSVIGESGVSSPTSGLPLAAADEELLLGVEPAPLQPASPMVRMADTAGLFMSLCFMPKLLCAWAAE